MFKCKECGSCCRNLNQNELYGSLDRGDGVCKYLSEEDDLCLIYAERPLICRVDDYYDKNLIGKLTRNEYYRLNYESCDKCRNLLKGET